MPIEPEPGWKSTGSVPLEINRDEDIDPARIGVYATDLPSAAKGSNPREYPRGWTTQQPWFHPEFPPPPLRCTRCAQEHPVGDCQVTRALVALGESSRP